MDRRVELTCQQEKCGVFSEKIEYFFSFTEIFSKTSDMHAFIVNELQFNVTNVFSNKPLVNVLLQQNDFTYFFVVYNVHQCTKSQAVKIVMFTQLCISTSS